MHGKPRRLLFLHLLQLSGAEQLPDELSVRRVEAHERKELVEKLWFNRTRWTSSVKG